MPKLKNKLSNYRIKAESILKETGHPDSFIRDHVGVSDFVTQKDKDGNILFIGPTGKMVVLDNNNRLYTGNMLCINFLNDTKYPEYSAELIKNSESRQFYVDLTHPNITYLEKQTIQDTVNSAFTEVIMDQSTDINWTQFIGKKVKIMYTKNGKIISLPQDVTSLDKIVKEDINIANVITNFLIESEKSIKETKYGPKNTSKSDHNYIETGKWVIQGLKDLYVSKIFPIYLTKNVENDNLKSESKEALPRLVEIVKQALDAENEENLNRSLLIHTHPGSGNPLSKEDIDTIKELSNRLGMDKGDIIEILAIPVKDRGKIIFRYSIKK